MLSICLCARRTGELDGMDWEWELGWDGVMGSSGKLEEHSQLLGVRESFGVPPSGTEQCLGFQRGHDG